MYKGKKISLAITSCQRIHFLRRVLGAFGVFCLDLKIVDSVLFFDDSSSQSEKDEMDNLLSQIFPDQNKIITHLRKESFPDTYRHSRILNLLREKLITEKIDYFFLLEDDYLFIDFFRIGENVDLLESHENYAYAGFSQSYKKFPPHIKPNEIEDYWEWYYDPEQPINSNLFLDETSAIQNLQPNLWMTYINWPSFTLRPGTHHAQKFLSVGGFSTSYDRSIMRTELEFAIRWSQKFKSLFHKRFHLINLGFDPLESSYTINSSE